ncbi:hypothetical protein EJ04DRAFT_580609 [Polyplosphaeria fusca]|uniref:Uncharacterized protein n=1 Tax=Polyplosphaeria fusca TaxID=682080 RepID=A0A9P4QLC7_9PLEO|nr:hypothetical protein EJ04DRAFT_580609 [Polyplosphaeria fusca]
MPATYRTSIPGHHAPLLHFTDPAPTHIFDMMQHFTQRETPESFWIELWDRLWQHMRGSFIANKCTWTPALVTKLRDIMIRVLDQPCYSGIDICKENHYHLERAAREEWSVNVTEHFVRLAQDWVSVMSMMTDAVGASLAQERSLKKLHWIANQRCWAEDWVVLNTAPGESASRGPLLELLTMLGLEQSWEEIVAGTKAWCGKPEAGLKKRLERVVEALEKDEKYAELREKILRLEAATGDVVALWNKCHA